MRRHFEHVDRQLDVHVALDAAPAHRVGEFLGRLGDHRVAVVIEPIDQRPDRRVFLVLEQRRIVECPDQPPLGAEQIQQPLVIYVELQAASGRIEVGAVNEYRNTFFRIEEHGYSVKIEISRYCHVREIARQARRAGRRVGRPVILIGIGSNLAAAGFASPLDTAAAAVARLSSVGIAVGAPLPLVHVAAGAAVGPALVRERCRRGRNGARAAGAARGAARGRGRVRAPPQRAECRPHARSRPARLRRDAVRRASASCCRTRDCTSAASCWPRWPKSRRNGAIRDRGRPPPSCLPLCRRSSSRSMRRPIRPPVGSPDGLPDGVHCG